MDKGFEAMMRAVSRKSGSPPRLLSFADLADGSLGDLEDAAFGIAYTNAEGIENLHWIKVNAVDANRTFPILKAYSYTDRGIRTFRIDRIRSVIDGNGEVEEAAGMFVVVDADTLDMDAPATAEEVARLRPAPHVKRAKIPPPPPVPDEEKARRAEARARDEAEAEVYQRAVLDEAAQRVAQEAALAERDGGGWPALTFIVGAAAALFGGVDGFMWFLTAALFLGTPAVAVFPRLMRVKVRPPRRLAAVGLWLAFLAVLSVVFLLAGAVILSAS